MKREFIKLTVMSLGIIIAHSWLPQFAQSSNTNIERRESLAKTNFFMVKKIVVLRCDGANDLIMSPRSILFEFIHSSESTFIKIKTRFGTSKFHQGSRKSWMKEEVCNTRYLASPFVAIGIAVEQFTIQADALLKAGSGVIYAGLLRARNSPDKRDNQMSHDHDKRTIEMR